MNIEELRVHGSAIVTAVDDCPEIALDVGWALSPTDGDARRVENSTHRTSVVTARFITREVNTIARAELIGPDGTNELIEGTPIHPVWSVDRNDWVPLGELTEGETLQASYGIATVLSLALVTCSQPVYNIEVHGEHVYQVGQLGLLVHNTCEGIYVFTTTKGKTYVGQSVDVARRLAEHVRDGKLASAASATIIQVTGGKTSREIAEQMLINSLGGVTPGGIFANRVKPIGLARAAEILLKNGIKIRS